MSQCHMKCQHVSIARVCTIACSHYICMLAEVLAEVDGLESHDLSQTPGPNLRTSDLLD